MEVPGTPPIRLENLTYCVDGNAVLGGLDLTVQAGEIVGVMGRSGVGTTTLLRLIMGLIRPTSGRIWVNGSDITAADEVKLDELRLDMGMVFQGAALFDSMTVGENVAFGLREHRRPRPAGLAERVAELLALVEMAGTEELMPAQLSGGMRKRVGVARALALAPSIMLYDEPTAGLDPISATAMGALIRRLRDEVGVTSVIVSHNVASLRDTSDRGAVLHDGHFIAVGPMAELVESSDLGVQQFLSGRPDGPLTEATGQ
jgi:phospholipid/cholesterol/gamma-HCH transport system ATP-binding protein